jgi:putative FmdB family regulatory protein
MPIYDVKCPQCGELTDIWAKIEEFKAKCPMCGKETQRLMSPTNIQCDLTPYFDENLADKKDIHGKWVKSRQHRKNIMKDQGLVEIG